MEIERRAWPGVVSLRAAEEGGPRRIVQRAVPFGELSEDMGGWLEVIEPGAFDIGGDVRALWQHNAAQVLGRTTAGTLVLREDETGIYSEALPPDTAWARDAMVSIERGDVTGSSFGFFVDDDEWVISNERVIRRIKRGRLLEVSPVTFPAYPQTSTQLRDHAAALRAQADAPTPPGDAGARARRAARGRQLQLLTIQEGS